MSFGRKYKRTITRVAVLILALTMLFGQLHIDGNPLKAEAAAAEQPVLVITGTGLKEDVIIYESDLSKYSQVERYFSSNNSSDFRKITKVRGYDLFDLLGEGNLKTDQDYNISFKASDNFSRTRTVSQLKSLHYYPEFIEATKENVMPLIASYKIELISIPKDDFNPPIVWNDKDLTEADKMSALQLIIGQAGINDKNQSSWVSKLVAIQVGDPRPPEDPVITIKGNGISQVKSFTLSQLKALPSQYRIDETYQYNSKGGLKTVQVKGVDLWYVLNTLVDITEPDAQVQFIASDGYPMDPQLQADISNPSLKYVLAYEIGGNPVNDHGGTAKLRIYRKQKEPTEFGTVFQAIIEIEVNGDQNTDPPVDFTNSPYKHINGGLPYDVDALTGATMTVEGPGVEAFRAISVRQLQEANPGLFRGTYAEKIGGVELQNSYEGITVAYILDNFVKLRSNAGKVIFKNKSRQVIGEYSLEEIRKADYLNKVTGANNLRMIVAYGINEVPLVYLNTDLGYISNKYNDNGCLKLVMGQKTALEEAPAFSNVAYIYVTEADAPGDYEHKNPPYNDPKYTNYILTLTGTGLGKEVNYTVKEIEAMTDMHVQKEYSLSNSQYYWYYNTYKGIPLWDLLLRAGLDPNIDENTKVQMIAADNYNFPAMTIRDIKNSNLYGYYEKDPNDLGDGKFNGSSVRPLEVGYPPLVAYGFNGYPYVTRPSDPGYNTGLGNDGGPLRIIFGKKSYEHNNGSEQVQFAKKVIIGENQNYTTHSYPPYDGIKDALIDIKVIRDGDHILSQQSYSLQEIEAMVYNVSASERAKAQWKDSYFTKFFNDGKISDLYEGISLKYLLFDKIGLPGISGIVTFENSKGNKLTIPLDAITRENYYNEVTGANNLKAILAFAKNGYPMISSKDIAKGYVSAAKNNDGPLMVLLGQTENNKPGDNLSDVVKITVDIVADEWAHMEPPYDAYSSNTLIIDGNGSKNQRTITVGELETLQNYIITDRYCLAKSASEKYEDTYRGIDLYEYLRKEIGLQANAATIKITAEDGTQKSFGIEEISKGNYINEISGQSNLKVMLAYGKNGKPLVPTTDSEGYVSEAKNSGGPLRLIVGQTQAGDLNNSKAISNVTRITVEASQGDSWKHNQGVYKQYEDQAVLRITGSQVKNPRTFSLKQLQDMGALIIRDGFTGDGTHQFEGLLLWNLIKDVVGLKDGTSTPSGITVFSGPGYNRNVDVNQVMKGIKNSQGENKEILLAYAINGFPLVPNQSSPGYDNNNAFGPLRLIVEENKSMWIKNTDCIVVGIGSYEEPKEEDIISDEPPTPATPPVTLDWAMYRNDNSSGLPLASVRCVTPDGDGGLWVGTNGGGAAYRSNTGTWTVYNTGNSVLAHNTIYGIAVDKDKGVWFVGGSPEDTGKPEVGIGAVYKKGNQWTVFNKANTNGGLQADFAQSVVVDASGGVWFGTAKGVSYLKDGQWTTFNKTHGLPADSVTQITLDNKGGSWIGFYFPNEGDPGGYAYIDKDKNVTVYTDDSGKWVRSISLDKNGGLWVARFGKVDYISPSGTRTIYTDKELIPSLAEGNSIRVAVAEANGGLWIGTTTGGLYYRDKDGKLAVLNNSNTWPTPQYNSVWYLGIASTGDLWVGTNGGVAYNKLSGYASNTPGGPGQPPKNWIVEVKGPGVDKTYQFALDELKAAGGHVSKTYFNLNSFGTEANTSFKGISLAYLLDSLVSMKGSATSVTITANDGYLRNYNLEDVRRDYISEKDPSARLPMILAWEEDGSPLTGQYPLKLVMGQTKTGDANKSNWVRNVKTITVNTHSVDSGSGTPGNYTGQPQAPMPGLGNMQDLSQHMTNTKVTVNGRIIEKIALDDKIIDLFAGSKNKDMNMLIKSQGESDQLDIEISGSLLMAGKSNNISLMLQNEIGTYFLPVSVLPINDIAQSLGLKPEDIKLSISISSVTSQREERLVNGLGPQQEILGNPVEFKIVAEVGGKKLEVSSFGSTYIKRQLVLNKVVSKNEATGILWSEQDNRLIYVPTLFELVDGKMIANIYSPTNSVYAVIGCKKTFSDIKNHWAEGSIELLASKLILAGRSEDSFSPDSSITKAEFATMLVRALGLREKASNSNGFKDIKGDEWYGGTIGAAVEAKLINGYPDQTFRPNNRITRQEMASITLNALKYLGKYEQIEGKSIDEILKKFSDRNQVPDWSAEALAVSIEAGIITGMPNNTIMANAYATRGQSATLIRKLLEYIEFMN